MYRLHFQKLSDKNNSTEARDSPNISQTISTQSNENTAPGGCNFFVNNNAEGSRVQNNIEGVTQRGKNTNFLVNNNAAGSVENKIREVDQEGINTNFIVNSNAAGSVENEIREVDQEGTSPNFNVNNNGRGNITNTISGVNQKSDDGYSMCENLWKENKFFIFQIIFLILCSFFYIYYISKQ